MNKIQKQNTMFETAMQRSSIYGFLALIYRVELTEALLKNIREESFLSMLSDLGANLEDDFYKKAEDDVIEDLAIEYTRLFLGPGKHISPHESIHYERDDGDWGSLWGGSTVEVKKFIETAGLKYKTEYSGLPDHISVELEFMQEAAKREAQAWDENNNAEALYCLKMEKKFVEEHLIKWVPLFCEKIISEADMSFYREMARITSNYVIYDSKELESTIQNIK